MWFSQLFYRWIWGELISQYVRFFQFMDIVCLYRSPLSYLDILLLLHLYRVYCSASLGKHSVFPHQAEVAVSVVWLSVDWGPLVPLVTGLAQWFCYEKCLDFVKWLSTLIRTCVLSALHSVCVEHYVVFLYVISPFWYVSYLTMDKHFICL